MRTLVLVLILIFDPPTPTTNRTPRVIECYADRFAVVGGRRYMIGHPCDWAVSVCTPKDEGSVEAVPLDSELMEELLPGLQVSRVTSYTWLLGPEYGILVVDAPEIVAWQCRKKIHLYAFDPIDPRMGHFLAGNTLQVTILRSIAKYQHWSMSTRNMPSRR